MKPFCVIGNWKLNGSKQFISSYFRKLASLLPAQLKKTTGILAPPVPYLAQVSALLLNSPIQMGAQAVDIHEEGAYTGEVSAKMLSDYEVGYVLVGHSERRHYHQESRLQLAQQCHQLCKASISPILCFGSTTADASENLADLTRMYTAEIIDIVLPSLSILGEKKIQLLLAYEPEAYIGKMTSAPAQAVNGLLQNIKETLMEKWDAVKPMPEITMLYGGSITPQNAQAFLDQSHVEGFLVGRSSLDPQAFSELIYLNE